MAEAVLGALPRVNAAAAALGQSPGLLSSALPVLGRYARDCHTRTGRAGYSAGGYGLLAPLVGTHVPGSASESLGSSCGSSRISLTLHEPRDSSPATSGRPPYVTSLATLSPRQLTASAGTAVPGLALAAMTTRRERQQCGPPHRVQHGFELPPLLKLPQIQYIKCMV